MTRLTGISQAMLRTKQALSVVVPQFLDWVHILVAEVSDATCTTHIPGITSVGAAEASPYKKKHPDDGIREMCDCYTNCMASFPFH